MKKKMLGIIAFAAIAAVAGWNYNQNMNNVNLSDLALENVEALASGEGGGACDGCSDIGWGTSKILECDCNYDHFSCCNRWGC
jgi:hypothetical protein